MMLISLLISIGYIILIVSLSVGMDSFKLKKDRKRIKQLYKIRRA